jgi:hypothetical protein
MHPAQLRRLARLESRAPAVEDDGAARERLMARYDQIAARLRAAPDWREPTAAEIAATMAHFEAMFPGIGERVAEAAKLPA